MSSPVIHSPDMEERSVFWRAFVMADVVASSFRRGSVFQTKDVKVRTGVRQSLARKVVRIARGYVDGDVCGEAHVRAIDQLAKEMTAEHNSALRCHRFRFGTAQKALNLYLKHAWLHDWISTPPHCPFDNVILRPLFSKLSNELCCESGDKWTQMDCPCCYRTWVRVARTSMSRGGYRSLSEWELREFNRRTAAMVK